MAVFCLGDNMKKVEMVGHQGDVVIFEIDNFPAGEKYQDELTNKGQLALGELSGHNHAFEDRSSVDLFKIKGYDGLSFFETKKPATLTHGLIKGFKGKEADQDYHSTLLLKEGKKYITGIVEETDWLTRTVRRVVD
jgi:hypothetical protein